MLRLFVLLLLLPLAVRAQPESSYSEITVPEAQQAKMVAYNVLLGASIGGLGALLNGEEDDWHERFARGAARGAFGGALLYSDKRMTQLVLSQEELAYGIPATLVHQVGSSVVENAALDDPMFSRIALHTGPVRVEWQPGGRVRARILPFNTAATVIVASRHTLDVGASLAFLTPVFTGPDRVAYPLAGGREVRGYAFLDNLYLIEGGDHELAAHELVHAFQFREHSRTTVLHYPLAEPFEEGRLYQALSPYLYVDNIHVCMLLYLGVEGGNQSALCYFDNWYEREAETLSLGRDVSVCE